MPKFFQARSLGEKFHPLSLFVYVCTILCFYACFHILFGPSKFCSLFFFHVCTWVGVRWLKHECHYPNFFKLGFQVNTSTPLFMFLLCPCFSHVFMCMVFCFCACLHVLFGAYAFKVLLPFSCFCLQRWECGGWNKSTMAQAFLSSGFRRTFPPHVCVFRVSTFFSCQCVHDLEVKSWLKKLGILR